MFPQNLELGTQILLKIFTLMPSWILAILQLLKSLTANDYIK